MLSTNLPQLIEDAKTPFWTIYNKAQRNHGSNPRMFEYKPSSDSPDGDMAESMEYLNKVLSYMTDGKYIIKHYKDEKQGKTAYFELEFTVSGKPVNTGSIAGVDGQNPYIGANIGEIVQKEVNALMDRKRLAELEIENTELKKQKEDPTGWKIAGANAINAINEHAPHLIPVFAQEIMGIIKGVFKRSTLAGPPESLTENYKPLEHTDMPQLSEEQIAAVEQEMDARQEEYAQVLMRLRLLDPDILNTLQKMATKAEANPSMIGMLKMML